MKEVWVKKTIWRRYLIDDDNAKAVETILSADGVESDNLVAEIYDTNEKIEYDNEQPVRPIKFQINEFKIEKSARKES